MAYNLVPGQEYHSKEWRETFNIIDLQKKRCSWQWDAEPRITQEASHGQVIAYLTNGKFELIKKAKEYGFDSLYLRLKNEKD